MSKRYVSAAIFISSIMQCSHIFWHSYAYIHICIENFPISQCVLEVYAIFIVCKHHPSAKLCIYIRSTRFHSTHWDLTDRIYFNRTNSKIKFVTFLFHRLCDSFPRHFSLCYLIGIEDVSLLIHTRFMWENYRKLNMPDEQTCFARSGYCTKCISTHFVRPADFWKRRHHPFDDFSLALLLLPTAKR